MSTRHVVVRTRLRPPVPPPGLVRRRRLLERLTGAREQVLAVCAPTGAGKSVLLADWVAQRSAGRWCWASLSPYDDHPAGVWSALLETVRPLRPNLAVPPPRVLEDRRELLTSVVPDLLNELLGGEPLTLVVDDLSAVDDPLALEALDVFLRQLPPHIQVAVAANRPLRLDSLPRLRAEGKVLDLDESALRFTTAEAQALFRTMGVHDVDGSAAARACEAVDGLAVAVRLAAVHEAAGTVDRASGGPVPELVEYVRSCVLDRVTSRQLRFLLRTCVLDEPAPDVCSALTGEPDAGLLDQLTASSLLIRRLPVRPPAYRYHPVLRGVAAAVLAAEDPAAVRDLHARAARWYTGRDRIAPVLRHAAAAGADHATEIVSRHWTDADPGEVLGWLSGLGRIDAATPLLRAIGAAASFVRGDEMSSWLSPGDRLADHDHPARAAVVAMTALRAGSLSRAAELATAALAAASTGRWWDTFAELALGTARLWAGRFDEARALLEHAVLVADRDRHRYVRTRARDALAILAYLDGTPDRGRRAAGDAATHSPPGQAPLAQCVLGCVEDGRAHGSRLPTMVDAARSLDRDDPHAAAMAWTLVALVANREGDLPVVRQCRERARYALIGCEEGVTLPEPAGLSVDSPFSWRPSGREHAVLRALPGPLSVKQIASELQLSPNTVKTHVRTIFLGLGAHSRAEAVARARERGLLPGGGGRPRRPSALPVHHDRADAASCRRA